MLIRMNGIHSASLRTRSFLLNNSRIRTYIYARTALYTLFFINVSLALNKRNCILRTHLHARVCETALAHLSNLDSLFRTLVTCKLDDVDKRWLIVLFRLYSLLCSLGYRCHFISVSSRKPHCESHTFSYNSSFNKNAVSIYSLFTGNDQIWYFFHI